VRDTIIHIPTSSNSNKIQSFVVVLVPFHLTLGCVVKCCRDHISFLDNLPDGMTLTQEVVASSILPVTEILAIEDHKTHDNFLHVAF
jgi:hypothetical protein